MESDRFSLDRFDPIQDHHQLLTAPSPPPPSLESSRTSRVTHCSAPRNDPDDMEQHVFHCYEFLSLRYLERLSVELPRGGDPDVWEELTKDIEDDNPECGAGGCFQCLEERPRHLRLLRRHGHNEWFLAVFAQEARLRLKHFLARRRGELLEDENDFAALKRPPPLAQYLSAFNFRELHLDNVFKISFSDNRTTANFDDGDQQCRLPTELFRHCPNVEVLSLRNNYLESLPPDIGRLKRLKKLFLTNNRLQNRSLPHALVFCTSLCDLYLDHNLLDALPGFLLQMSSLTTVHRHGNHNYFKATFMWYHTDVNDRILEDRGMPVHNNHQQQDPPFQQGSLQELAAKAILSSGLDFFSCDGVPHRLREQLSEASGMARLCGNCRAVRSLEDPGFKVFTFKNPYLGNTCVPFLHWACSRECAEWIEIPARREQLTSAQEQDRLYQQCIRETVANLRPSQRSISSVDYYFCNKASETQCCRDEDEDAPTASCSSSSSTTSICHIL